jgi:hypothetical protein
MSCGLHRANEIVPNSPLSLFPLGTHFWLLQDLLNRIWKLHFSLSLNLSYICRCTILLLRRVILLHKNSRAPSSDCQPFVKIQVAAKKLIPPKEKERKKRKQGQEGPGRQRPGRGKHGHLPALTSSEQTNNNSKKSTPHNLHNVHLLTTTLQLTFFRHRPTRRLERSCRTTRRRRNRARTS